MCSELSTGCYHLVLGLQGYSATNVLHNVYTNISNQVFIDQPNNNDIESLQFIWLKLHAHAKNQCPIRWSATFMKFVIFCSMGVMHATECLKYI